MVRISVFETGGVLSCKRGKQAETPRGRLLYLRAPPQVEEKANASESTRKGKEPSIPRGGAGSLSLFGATLDRVERQDTPPDVWSTARTYAKCNVASSYIE